MTTVVVYEKGTRDVIAAIPLADGETAVCRNDVEFQIFNGTDPVFEEVPGGIILKANSFFLNMGDDKDAEKQG